jgi:CRISPR/Cas system endoribonuclease Cas6 (RAMP superfamily)
VDLGAKARAVQSVQIQVKRVEGVERLSGRTGQQHPLGGFTGWAIYRGELDPFLEILATAEYAGVGRQTVWGKGQIHVTAG